MTYVTDAHAAEETETLFLSTAKFREFVRENPTQALTLVAQLLAERAQFLSGSTRWRRRMWSNAFLPR
jgi:hypothetical protein